MIPALITAVLWAMSATCGQRAAKYLGSMRANRLRLGLATVLLGLITLVFHQESFSGPTLFWLGLSGVVGFGIGDAGLYLALARIGTRITVLITFCFAPVFGALGEWLWFGTVLPWQQAMAAVGILFGVCLTLKPTSPATERYGNVPLGFVMAFVAALGQGFGAVLTQRAIQAGTEIGVALPPFSQAFQRVVSGLVFGLLLIPLVRLSLRNRQSAGKREPLSKRNLGWLVGAALLGPVIGLAFYQQALNVESHGSIVLVIIALMPVFTIPLAWWLEKDKPTRQSLIGSVIAVGCLILLALLRR